MPELPEVETVVRELQYLQGAKLIRITTNDKKVWFESEFNPLEIHGKKIEKIHRHGKYIIFSFSNGHVLQHLRMTGKMLRSDSPHIPNEVRKKKREQIRCEFLTNQGEVFFYDTRRFGTLTTVKNLNNFFQKKKIAPDALMESLAAKKLFMEAARQSPRPIKAVLLDQSVIAGVGNIYADEVLYLARVYPGKISKKITEKKLMQIFELVGKVFVKSISVGGTTVNNYLSADGNKGRYVERLYVYGRAGELCRICKKEKIKVIRLAGRSTHFCPNCQN